MPSSEPNALQCAGVAKRFGSRVVLDGVDLDVPLGGITAILGPSGEGKTTLLRIIAGFEHADAGTVTVHGNVVDGAGRPTPPERRRVGFVPQEGALFPHLSVAGNVGFGLPRGRERARRVRECLELVGLPGAERARPDELSGGQQQRIALARALAPEPELVLLDEPFSSLDAALREEVREEVAAVLRRARCTAVVVTHDQEEALSVADHVAVLLGGCIAQYDAPTVVYQAPATLAVARFVGEAVVLPGKLGSDHQVSCVLGTLPLGDPTPPDATAGDAVQVVIRPEQLVLDRAGTGVAATVTACEFRGPDARVDVALDPSAGGVCLRVRMRADDLPAVGTTVGVQVSGGVTAFPAG